MLARSHPAVRKFLFALFMCVGKRKKINLPVDQYPNVDFVELIRGPDGERARSIEYSTGARVSLRGRGAPPEYTGAALPADSDEPLHVLLQADTDVSMDQASARISALLADPT